MAAFRPTVGVFAQVPAEAQCLQHNLPSLRQLGDVIVFSAGAGSEVAAAAGRLGVEVVPVPWTLDYGRVLTALAEHLGDGPWLFTYGDERIVDGLDTSGWAGTPRVAAADVRHRVTDRDSYREEKEVRCVGAGAGRVHFTGLVQTTLHWAGSPVDPDEAPHSGLVIEHFPSRWPDLARQRVDRRIEAWRAGLERSPHDPGLLAGLLRCHYLNHHWPQLREVAARWRAVAAPDDPAHPGIDYQDACAAVALGTPEESLRLVDAAVRRAPRFADAWYLAGELYAAAGRDAEADAAFRTAGELGDDADPVLVEDGSLSSWRPIAARAALAKRAGKVDEARRLRDAARARRDAVRQG